LLLVACRALRPQYDFTYSTAAGRRAVAEDAMRSRARRLGWREPGPRIVLLGKPASGKGTIAPMLSCAYRLPQVGLGNLLRSRLRADAAEDDEIAATMRAGKLISDEAALAVVTERLTRSDAAAGGWLLDGFPRTPAQAKGLLDDEEDLLAPDCVIVLDRPDDLALDVALGRCTDSATGDVYHPTYAPAPPEVECRLVWRTDDREEVLRERLAAHEREIAAVLAAFGDIPCLTFDNARSEVETFAEVCGFIDGVEEAQRGRRLRAARAARRQAAYAAPRRFLDATARIGGGSASQVNKAATGGSSNEEDVAALCRVDESLEECEARRGLVQNLGLREVVARCNTYDPARYAPVMVGDRQVGFVSAPLLYKLRGWRNAVEVGPNPLPFVRRGRSEDDEDDNTSAPEDEVSHLAVYLAPHADSVDERTHVVSALVEALVADSELLLARPDADEVAFVPRAKLRGELQDVRALGDALTAPPLLRLERAAVVAFGVPSFGCHINGFVVDKDGETLVWLAKRALSKPTYPGLLDQIAAGGLPAHTSLIENAKKEAGEEASIPAEILDRDLRAAGAVSYRYAARRGLSTKTLCVFDLELPADLVPLNGDGEVDSFVLMPVEEAVQSLRAELYRWKPNSALVMLDFAMRRGYVSADDPEYIMVAHDLRSYSASSRSSVEALN